MHLRASRPLLPAVLCLSGLVLLASAAAQDNPLEKAADPAATRPSGNPLDPDPAWSGLWVDQARGVGVVLLPNESRPDECEGLVIVVRREEGRNQEATYELKGKVAGERLEGTFKVQTKDFPFKAALEGGVLVLESGKSSYRLPRAPDAGSAVQLRRQLTNLRTREGRGGAAGNEAMAIGALKTLVTAQTLFREGDKEQDGQLDYGSLAELSQATLIDGVLGSGKKAGYVFDCRASTTTPEFLWFATAAPEQPGTTGSRYFLTNHAGVIYYSNERPFVVNPDSCAIPEGSTPVGK